MNEICIEHCAAKRDCSAFEPKPNLKLTDMPRFPLNESANMTKEEKFTSVTVYLATVVDHLQGNEEPVIPYRAARASIVGQIVEVSTSLQDVENKVVLTKTNGSSSHEINRSENKEQ